MPVEAVRWGSVRIVGGDEAVVEPPRGFGDLAVEGSQRTLAMEEDDGYPPGAGTRRSRRRGIRC